MSRRTATYVEWVCDDGGEWTIQLAKEGVPDGWEVIDGKDVCGRCVARRACATEGHDFGPWLRSYFYPSKEYRSCNRCDGREESRDA